MDGGWAGWSSWSSCSKTCGGGEQSRSRTCSAPAPAHGGLVCPGSDTETQSCQTGACPPVDGSWAAWGDWGDCTDTCQGPKQSRVRNCTNPAPAHGGADCGGMGEEMKDCGLPPSEGLVITGGWGADQWVEVWNPVTGMVCNGPELPDQRRAHSAGKTALPCSAVQLLSFLQISPLPASSSVVGMLKSQRLPASPWHPAPPPGPATQLSSPGGGT